MEEDRIGPTAEEQEGDSSRTMRPDLLPRAAAIDQRMDRGLGPSSRELGSELEFEMSEIVDIEKERPLQLLELLEDLAVRRCGGVSREAASGRASPVLVVLEDELGRLPVLPIRSATQPSCFVEDSSASAQQRPTRCLSLEEVHGLSLAVDIKIQLENLVANFGGDGEEGTLSLDRRRSTLS